MFQTMIWYWCPNCSTLAWIAKETDDNVPDCEECDQPMELLEVVNQNLDAEVYVPKIPLQFKSEVAQCDMNYQYWIGDDETAFIRHYFDEGSVKDMLYIHFYQKLESIDAEKYNKFIKFGQGRQTSTIDGIESNLEGHLLDIFEQFLMLTGDLPDLYELKEEHPMMGVIKDD